MADYAYQHFIVSLPQEYVAHVELNRPEKLNAFHEPYVTSQLISVHGGPVHD